MITVCFNFFFFFLLGDEYRSLVDKYAEVRNEFERKMSISCDVSFMFPFCWKINLQANLIYFDRMNSSHIYWKP